MKNKNENLTIEEKNIEKQEILDYYCEDTRYEI